MRRGCSEIIKQMHKKGMMAKKATCSPAMDRTSAMSQGEFPAVGGKKSQPQLENVQLWTEPHLFLDRPAMEVQEARNDR